MFKLVSHMNSLWSNNKTLSSSYTLELNQNNGLISYVELGIPIEVNEHRHTKLRRNQLKCPL